jgi:integrase
VQFVAEGVTLTVRRSRTDQEGKAAVLAIPYGSTLATCPVRALRAWLDDAAIASGAVLRSVKRHGAIGARFTARSLALVVKRAAAAGLDVERLSAHSLRAGCATQAAKRTQLRANQTTRPLALQHLRALHPVCDRMGGRAGRAVGL